jgi:hypothetical protein
VKDRLFEPPAVHRAILRVEEEPAALEADEDGSTVRGSAEDRLELVEDAIEIRRLRVLIARRVQQVDQFITRY